MARKRKSIVQYIVVCSGKGEPWHQSRTHRTNVKSALAGAVKTCDDLNNNPRYDTPLQKECHPWHIEKREMTQWETINQDETASPKVT